MSFLVPSGPFGVGSVTRELIDRGRPSHLLNDTAGRRLFLKLWYPAERGTGDDDERIWQELRTDARTPALVRALLGCLRARTATRVNGRFVARAPTSSVVAYNHGSVSFAAENTSLMQELASHGYTVVAIQHAEQLAEFKALGRADSPEKKKADAELAQRLKEAPSAERPKLAVEYFQASTNTNRVVVERAADTSFVLSHIANVVAKSRVSERTRSTPRRLTSSGSRSAARLRPKPRSAMCERSASSISTAGCTERSIRRRRASPT